MTNETGAEPVLELRGVSKQYRRRGSVTHVTAVDGVDLTIRSGESFALVGESGSGKSTLAKLALCLERPDAGQILLRGRDLTGLRVSRLRRVRTAMQPIFQDASASFNPRRSVESALFQALGRLRTTAERRAHAVDLLERVGLRPAPSFLDRMPHELSGGQRQRLAIARALAADPVLVVADEPLSGADVSVRGQVMNLLADLQAERALAYLFITHDVSLARSFADRVGVMHHGRLVEVGTPEAVLDNPADPYTKRLVHAVPDIEGPEPVPAFDPAPADPPRQGRT
ncbi:ABC transporter ATP-binding protein [Jiangella sp. DSM 45060]|uniref:ABC transporter ATP-binding protein n=1 Tax=Jiangella sp. DSM 45060 TaxID=1798224 RepID=UPI0008796953|nr:ABC transporter ATP-binding protein [Jiangella sp. DSM 45060]SDT16551.1 peptide/nickel transport system ATP-binding protein [Jiangella sp. DSM 45060]